MVRWTVKVPDPIELDRVDSLGAGAVGRPGQRAFYVQARKGDAVLTVLMEKEQVAMLAGEAETFLDGLADSHPEPPEPLEIGAGELREPTVPLFRVRTIGLGFEPERDLVLIELRERIDADDEEDDADDDVDDEEALEGWVARVWATRAQVRAMVRRGSEAVAGGRARCPLCSFPMDPDGHICPRWN